MTAGLRQNIINNIIYIIILIYKCEHLHSNPFLLMYNQRHHKEEKDAQDLWTEIEYVEFCLLLFVCPTDVKVTFQNIKIFQNSPNAMTTQGCFKMPMGW